METTSFKSEISKDFDSISLRAKNVAGSKKQFFILNYLSGLKVFLSFFLRKKQKINFDGNHIVFEDNLRSQVLTIRKMELIRLGLNSDALFINNNRASFIPEKGLIQYYFRILCHALKYSVAAFSLPKRVIPHYAVFLINEPVLKFNLQSVTVLNTISPSLFLLASKASSRFKVNYFYSGSGYFRNSLPDKWDSVKLFFFSKIMEQEYKFYNPESKAECVVVPDSALASKSSPDIAFFSTGDWARHNGHRRKQLKRSVSQHNTLEKSLIESLKRFAIAHGKSFKVYLHPYEKELLESGVPYPYDVDVMTETSLVDHERNILDPVIGICTSSSVIYQRLTWDLPTFFLANPDLGTITFEEVFWKKNLSFYAYLNESDLLQKLQIAIKNTH